MELEAIEAFVESFVEEHFRDVSAEDKHSLKASALIHIDEQQSIPLGQEELLKFRQKLRRDLNTDYGSSPWHLPTRDPLSTEETFSNEDNDQRDPFADLRSEVQQADMNFEDQRESLKNFLPPILFEALNRLVDPATVPQLTAEFSDDSLKILGWRAWARILNRPTS